jgi:uncharacterized protein involved in outer membrane biogenesis
VLQSAFQVQTTNPEKTSKTLTRRIFLGKPFLVAAGLLLLLFLFYSVAGFFLIPLIAKRQLLREAAALGRSLAIDEIRLNPFSLDLRVRGLAIRENDGEPLFTLDEIHARLRPGSFFQKEWTFSDLRLGKPYLLVKVSREGELNISRLAGQIRKGIVQEKPPSHSEGGPAVHFERIQVRDGRIQFADFSGTAPASIELGSFRLDLKDLCTSEKKPSVCAFRASLPRGGSLEWTGSVHLNPVVAEGRFALKGLKAEAAWPFFRDRLNLKGVQGSLDTGFRIRVASGKTRPQILVRDLSLGLRGLSLTLAGEEEPALTLEEVTLSGGRCMPASGEISVGRILIKGGGADLRPAGDGSLNWSRIVTKGSAPVERKGATSPWRLSIEEFLMEEVALRYLDQVSTAPVEGSIKITRFRFSSDAEESGDGVGGRVRDLSLDGSEFHIRKNGEEWLSVPELSVSEGWLDSAKRSAGLGKIAFTGGHVHVRRDPAGRLNWSELLGAREPAPTGEETSEKPAWQAFVSKLLLDRFGIDWVDRSLYTPAELRARELRLEVAELSNGPGSRPRIDLSFQVEQGGEVSMKGTLDPEKRGGECDLEVRSLGLVPFRPYLASFPLLLNSGAVSVKGELKYGGAERLLFEGAASLDDFSLQEQNAVSPLFSWDSIHAKHLRVDGERKDIVVDTLSVRKPFARILIREDRTLNLQEVFTPKVEQDTKEEPGRRAQPPDPGAGKNIQVKRAEILEGRLDFSDWSLPLPFAVRVEGLAGSIAGLSSAPDRRASIGLQGRVGQYGSLRLKGDLQPLNAKGYSDVKMVFRNVEMATLSPYSIKFAGRKIISGKLSLDLRYRVKDGRLSGDNQITMESLALGEKVGSSGVADLPLGLALALLRDADDRIRIGLPVSGDVNDPHFSFGELYWKAFTSLFTKIVAAPIFALAALIGGNGRDLDQVFFDPGRAGLPPPEAEKIASLANGLRKRPRLSVHVQTGFDPVIDGREMKSAALRRDILSRTGAEPGPGEDPGPVDMSDPEVQGIIETLAARRMTPQEVDGFRRADPHETKESAPPAARSRADFCERLLNTLIERESIGDAALQEVAKRRAESILEELAGQGVERARVQTLPPSHLDAVKERGVPARLSLKEMMNAE